MVHWLLRLWHRKPETFGDPSGEVLADLRQDADHSRSDRGHLNVAELKSQSLYKVTFFRRGLTVIEKLCLAKMIVKARAAFAHLVRVDAFRKTRETAVLHHRLKRTSARERIWFIGHASLVDRLPMNSVALIIVDGRDRAIDRNFVEVRPFVSQRTTMSAFFCEFN